MIRLWNFPWPAHCLLQNCSPWWPCSTFYVLPFPHKVARVALFDTGQVTRVDISCFFLLLSKVGKTSPIVQRNSSSASTTNALSNNPTSPTYYRKTFFVSVKEVLRSVQSSEYARLVKHHELKHIGPKVLYRGTTDREGAQFAAHGAQFAEKIHEGPNLLRICLMFESLWSTLCSENNLFCHYWSTADQRHAIPIKFEGRSAKAGGPFRIIHCKFDQECRNMSPHQTDLGKE